LQGIDSPEAALKKRYQSAWQSFKDGHYENARQQSEKLNLEFPTFTPGWDLSSRIALAMHRREAALEYSERALHIDANRFAFQAQKAYCLFALHRDEAALELLQKLEGADLQHAAEHDTLGNLYSLGKDQAAALKCFERAVELEPGNAHFQMNTALARQALGDLGGAESAMDTAIALRPEDHQAWLHRSRLRRQTAEKNHAREMESLIEKGIESWHGAVNIRYALAKEYEDLQDYQASFHHLKAGSALRRRHMNHDAQADLEAIEAIKGSFAKDFFLRIAPGHESDEPIFIVGLPRTGTTLVERILGSHSEVHAAGELNNFAENLTRQVMSTNGEKPANREQFIEAATRVDFADLGTAYVQSTRPYTGKTKRFVDKLPLNFLYCGLIAKALPNARIIHLTRHPMDTCFAVYKTLFKQAYPFSYDLTELGRYYLAYRSLMQHWHRSMPGKILDVSYENLTRDQENESRRIVSHCGLEWEDTCLEFHQNPEPSMTASLAQVRQPIYSTSVGRWRNYAAELEPLAGLLREASLEN